MCNKTAVATKVIHKSNSFSGSESQGFKRYMALPRKAAFNMKKGHYLRGCSDHTFTKTVADFFGNMTESEYRTWLLVNL